MAPPLATGMPQALHSYKSTATPDGCFENETGPFRFREKLLKQMRQRYSAFLEEASDRAW